MIEGLLACHVAGVCHGDLTPNNILFDADYKIRIVDFGFSSSLNESPNNSFGGQQVRNNYSAPETQSRQNYNGVSADIF